MNKKLLIGLISLLILSFAAGAVFATWASVENIMNKVWDGTVGEAAGKLRIKGV